MTYEYSKLWLWWLKFHKCFHLVLGKNWFLTCFSSPPVDELCVSFQMAHLREWLQSWLIPSAVLLRSSVNAVPLETRISQVPSHDH